MPTPLLYRQLHTQLSQWITPTDKLSKAWAGMPMRLTLDTSMLWDEYCLIEVCLAWGGRSLPITQKVIKHVSAKITFADYCAILHAAKAVLSMNYQVTLLADRCFEHGKLIWWLRSHQWSWAIRALIGFEDHVV